MPADRSFWIPACLARRKLAIFGVMCVYFFGNRKLTEEDAIRELRLVLLTIGGVKRPGFPVPLSTPRFADGYAKPDAVLHVPSSDLKRLCMQTVGCSASQPFSFSGARSSHSSFNTKLDH